MVFVTQTTSIQDFKNFNERCLVQSQSLYFFVEQSLVSDVTIVFKKGEEPSVVRAKTLHSTAPFVTLVSKVFYFVNYLVSHFIHTYACNQFISLDNLTLKRKSCDFFFCLVWILLWDFFPVRIIFSVSIFAGNSIFCLRCGHGGHTTHIQDWFKDNAVCPTGCSCRCVEAKSEISM